MDRRSLLAGLLSAPAANAIPDYGNATRYHGRAEKERLMRCGPVTSRADGQIIENLDVDAPLGNGVSILHRQVTVRNCRICHAGGHGVNALNAPELVLQDLEIDNVGAPSSGVGPSTRCNNIYLYSCPNATITRVKASRGSSNIYAVNSEGIRMTLLELHDARGPFPRGQNVQLHRSPNSILEDFSAENGPTSWTEDNVSVFRSDRCLIRRGLVCYNNSPTGDGVMIEGSFDCVVEDVDAVQQGNGAFAAVPQGDAGSGGCTFLRCRTSQTYNAARDGRTAPSSNGLSIYVRVSPGAPRHTITACRYDALANPKNLIWDGRAVNHGWTFRREAFVPREPIRLAFDW